MTSNQTKSYSVIKRIAFVCWVHCFCVAVSGYSDQFEILGHATFDVYANGVLQESRTNNFVISTRDSDWDVLTWSRDNSYRIECAQSANNLRTLINNNGKNVGFVEQTNRPTFSNPFLKILWLTYCSASYFKLATNGTVYPIWDLDNPSLSDKESQFRAKLVLNHEFYEIPLEIYYISDGFYHGIDPQKKQPINIELPSPYNMGYTCAVFRVNSTTNVNAFSIPSEFYFEKDSTPLDGRKPTPRTIMQGEVDSIKSFCSISNFLPSYNGMITIWDYPIVKNLPEGSVKGKALSYSAYDGDWPQDKHLAAITYKYLRTVAFSKAVDKRINEAQKLSVNTKHQTITRIVFFTLIFVLSLFPIFILRKRN